MTESDEIKTFANLYGKFEISFSFKEGEENVFNPLKPQLFLAIGKSGRANKLLFKDLDSKNVGKLIGDLKTVKDELEKIENDDLNRDPNGED